MGKPTSGQTIPGESPRDTEDLARFAFPVAARVTGWREEAGGREGEGIVETRQTLEGEP